MTEKKQEIKNDINTAIVNVMRDIGAIGKNDTNDFDHYKFRGIDAVYNAIQPALVKNGVYIVPKCLSCEQEDRTNDKNKTMVHTRVMVEYTLYGPDGSNRVTVFPGEGIDRSDKSTNKAMTAAYKYMLFELFTIPTEDLSDADKESPEAGTLTPKAAEKAKKESAHHQIVEYFYTHGIKEKADIDAISDEFKLTECKTDAEFAEKLKEIKAKYGE